MPWRYRIESSGLDWASAETAVAEFGLLLFDSKYKGNASYEQVLDLARANRGDDIHGYRGEFVRLVELAKELAGKH